MLTHIDTLMFMSDQYYSFFKFMSSFSLFSDLFKTNLPTMKRNLYCLKNSEKNRNNFINLKRDFDAHSYMTEQKEAML